MGEKHQESGPANGIVRVDLGGPGDGWASHASEAVDLAAEAVRRDGVVIVENVVDPSILRRIKTRMTADLEILAPRPHRAENFAPGHLQQDPPPEPNLLTPEILAHPYVLQVCRAVMSQPLRLTGYSNNTNMAGSRAQAVHVDEGQLWPGLLAAHPPARLTVNIPLTTTSEEGGALEVWPGTHDDVGVCQYSTTRRESLQRALEYVRVAKEAGVEGQVNRRVGLTVARDALAERRALRPPVRAVTTEGGVIIRDPRLWHRGTPNRSDHTRFMLALTYDPHWRSSEPPIELPHMAREIFEHARLDVNAVYVDGRIDHLDRHLPFEGSPLKRASPHGQEQPERA
ncbi:phytanoyl-CoA dioxygenase family protein [Streptomyces xanthochromogenes]|uniref:phytanoyl-CoA dioxygenase family protein n=1 Tax=Streptomyces xanthochromogenes TaxID=67384 RepID=UPI0034371A60